MGGAPIVKMLKQLTLAGAKTFYNARLSSIQSFDEASCTDCVILGFDGGPVDRVRTKSVILNLPRNALLNLTRGSVLFTETPWGPKEARDRIGCADNSPS